MSSTVVVSPSKLRADYSRLLRKLAIGDDKYIITSSVIRVENPLQENQNSYQFDLVENSSSDRPLEEKLNRNDLFAITHIRIGITRQDESVNPAQYGNFKLFTTNDANFFTGTNEANALANIYNGTLTVKTDNVERLQRLNTNLFEYIPERGYIIANAPQVADEFPMSGPTLEERGYFYMQPQIILSGDQSNILTVNLGTGDTTGIAGAGPQTNVLVCELFGYQVNNAVQPSLRVKVF